MIAFATLLLGIVFGVETLELEVGKDVVVIEIHLDGTLVSRLERPPWRVDIDFGPRPTPHLVEAVARDADGAETGRAEQWLNLPNAPAEASIVVERLTDGGAVATIAWESLAGAQPKRVEASFDGKAIDVSDPKRIALPPYDDRALHFLRVELVFSDTVSSVIERTLGGTYTDSVSTELTAIPVGVDKPRRKLDAAMLAGRLTAGGTLLEVVAVESGPALAVFVADRVTFRDLSWLIEPRLTRQQQAAGEAWATLARRQRLRFLWPVTQRHAGASRAYDLFHLSETFEASRQGVYFLMRNVSRPLYVDRGPQRLADAVANAALEAASRRRTRAVVLVLSNQPEDKSELSIAHVRAYLQDLQIPLVIWNTVRPVTPSPWGEAVAIGDPLRFVRAAHDLADLLRSQRIVWVQGRHLPQTIELVPSSETAGLELVR